MTLEQALLWADTFGKMQGCTPDDPPDGNSPALLALAAEVRRLNKGWHITNGRALERGLEKAALRAEVRRLNEGWQESNVRTLECEAGAAAMREALETCKRLPIARGYPDGPCLDSADHEEVCAALASSAGRELMAEVERLREDVLTLKGMDNRLVCRLEAKETECVALLRKVTAAGGMAEAFEHHRCGCQNQELRAALAVWNKANQ